MALIKADAGVPLQLQSCHTTLIGDYVFEGHIPADVIARFLDEKPNAKGLGFYMHGSFQPVALPQLGLLSTYFSPIFRFFLTCDFCVSSNLHLWWPLIFLSQVFVAFGHLTVA